MEDINTVKLDAANLGFCRQVEQGIEFNARFRIRPLAHKPRPHGIVELGKIVL